MVLIRSVFASGHHTERGKSLAWGASDDYIDPLIECGLGVRRPMVGAFSCRYEMLVVLHELRNALAQRLGFEVF